MCPPRDGEESACVQQIKMPEKRGAYVLRGGEEEVLRRRDLSGKPACRPLMCAHTPCSKTVHPTLSRLHHHKNCPKNKNACSVCVPALPKISNKVPVVAEKENVNAVQSNKRQCHGVVWCVCTVLQHVRGRVCVVGKVLLWRGRCV